MGKEITLPWNCDTGKKMITPIGIVLMIAGIICWIAFFSNGGPVVDTLHIALFIYMLLGTATGLSLILFDCVENERFPTFKCEKEELK